MEKFNSACNCIAFLGKSTNKYELQRMAYRKIGEKFGLSARMAMRAILRVVETRKGAQNALHSSIFDLRGAIPVDTWFQRT